MCDVHFSQNRNTVWKIKTVTELNILQQLVQSVQIILNEKQIEMLKAEQKCSTSTMPILISILIDFNIKVPDSQKKAQVLANQIYCKIKSRKANTYTRACELHTHTRHLIAYVCVKGKRYLLTTLCTCGSGTKGIVSWKYDWNVLFVWKYDLFCNRRQIPSLELANNVGSVLL